MHGELGADVWVLEKYKNSGFYVDAGCADGEEYSNTVVLEKNGWKGICIDAYPRNFNNRNCVVEKAVLGSEKGQEVTFIYSEDLPNLSGISGGLGWHANTVLQSKHRKETHVTERLSDILDRNNAPNFIEYMNLDIEGGEYDVLRTFPFEKYKFGCISVEHNFEEPKRTKIRQLLESKGYKHDREVKWDDWYTSI
jgi:FkbM family methyltransferase